MHLVHDKMSPPSLCLYIIFLDHALQRVRYQSSIALHVSVLSHSIMVIQFCRPIHQAIHWAHQLNPCPCWRLYSQDCKCFQRHLVSVERQSQTVSGDLQARACPPHSSAASNSCLCTARITTTRRTISMVDKTHLKFVISWATCINRIPVAISEKLQIMSAWRSERGRNELNF